MGAIRRTGYDCPDFILHSTGLNKCHLPCRLRPVLVYFRRLFSPEGDNGAGRITVGAACLSPGMRRGLLFVGVQGAALEAVSPSALRWPGAGRGSRNASARRFPGKGDD